MEAIDREDPALLQEELGDVLLQVVFHARMEEEAGRFAFADVVDEVCRKLIVRHPHIFAGMLSWVCSLSQGQPSFARSRSIILTR